MTPRRALSITAALFAAHALFLPSCVQWNIGEKIRERAETRVGADVTQRFRCGEPPRLVAPEVSYRAATPLITFFKENDPAAQEVTPTGRWREVTLPRIKGPRMYIPSAARTTVGGVYTGDPQQARREAPGLSYRPTADNARWLGTAERRREEGYALAATLAAPFDYCIDPVLSTVSTALFIPVVGTYVLLGVAYDKIAY